jgi:hypothetical protein
MCDTIYVAAKLDYAQATAQDWIMQQGSMPAEINIPISIYWLLALYKTTQIEVFAALPYTYPLPWDLWNSK